MDKFHRSNWANYVEYVSKVLDPIDLNDKVLLEIAPGECSYVHMFADRGLAKYIGVEPNKHWLLTAKKRLEYVNVATEYEFVNSTYEDYKQTCPVDIIYSSGLIYHLASPLHYLEYIANYNAEYIVIEHTGNIADDSPHVFDEAGNLNEGHIGGVCGESVNNPGMRLSEALDDPQPDRPITASKKTIPLNMFISCYMIVWCMEFMGYRLEAYNNLQTGERSKSDNCVMRFRLENI